NEAFASQALAVIPDLGLPHDAEHVNPKGGAIALGHPLGMSGARLVTTAAYELQERLGRYALCSMCIGVGQGIALILERIKSILCFPVVRSGVSPQPELCEHMSRVA